MIERKARAIDDECTTYKKKLKKKNNKSLYLSVGIFSTEHNNAEMYSRDLQNNFVMHFTELFTIRQLDSFSCFTYCIRQL